MYYDERKINGVWMWRSTSTGDWQRFTNEGRRWRMLADVMAMAERAHTAATVAFLDHEGKQRVRLKRHERNCRRFVSELEQEARNES